MKHRDEFPADIKRKLALRAAYRCSHCRRHTAGPSDEGPTATLVIGVAAHIAAASPGGPRYDSEMLPAERGAIENGIWLCASDATLVDRDTAVFTSERLREMKQAHEEWCSQELMHPRAAELLGDLVAIGSDLVVVGSLVSGDAREWRIRARHFATGDFSTLLELIDRFEDIDRTARYVVANELGDGRVLAAPPRWERTLAGYDVVCPITESWPRQAADELGGDLALSADGDLVIERGDLAVVSGAAAVPQKIRLALLTRVGDLPMHPTYGSRLAEYYQAFRGSPWLERYLKIDVIRLAAIPFYDEVTGAGDTPLQCVTRVFGVEVLGADGSPEIADAGSSDSRLRIKVDLEVKGLGRESHEIDTGRITGAMS